MGNVELLRERLGRAVEDPEYFYAILDPDVVWDVSDTASPLAGIYRGIDQVRAFYRRWSSAFSDWNLPKLLRPRQRPRGGGRPA